MLSWPFQKFKLNPFQIIIIRHIYIFSLAPPHDGKGTEVLLFCSLLSLNIIK